MAQETLPTNPNTYLMTTNEKSFQINPPHPLGQISRLFNLSPNDPSNCGSIKLQSLSDAISLHHVRNALSSAPHVLKCFLHGIR